MSDFLISLQEQYSASLCLDALKGVHQPDFREGLIHSGSGVNAAILRERIGTAQNWKVSGLFLVGWIGDIPGGPSLAAGIISEIDRNHEQSATAGNLARALARSTALASFDGSGAVIIAGPDFAAFITDPMGGVQVYLGEDVGGRTVAAGSHPDLVAQVAGRLGDLDPVSLVEYLDAGTACCPFTLYRGVREQAPGTVTVVAGGQTATATWWTPPREEAGLNLDDAAEEFARHWRTAVEKRCSGGRIAVQLSGGMDSRAVMAVLPKDLKADGLTFGDEINREAQLSQRVASCYGREWKFLPRDPEYLGRTAAHATRFTGCEGEWHHAHAIGLLPAFRDPGYTDVFTGLFMDNNFKGYYAEDIITVRRAGGWLPPRQVRQPRDYVGETSRWVKEVARPDLLDARLARRRAFYEGHFARGRQSEWEWLDGHPVSQASDNTGWFVERRLLPLRLPVYDRALVELAFRIPATAKAGGAFFSRALVKFLGPGNWIPNANDGSKPGSGAAAQQFQRLARKAQRTWRNQLDKVGIRGTVQHSWHDYRHYWNTSPVVRDLLQRCEPALAQHDGVLRSGSLRDHLSSSKLPWRQLYRLLQLGLWSDPANRNVAAKNLSTVGPTLPACSSA